MNAQNTYRPVIVAVGYNRTDSLVRLLKSLEDAVYPFEDIPLYVSLDHSAKEDEVIEAVNSVPWTHGPKTVRKHTGQLGLRKHILECGSLSERYGAAVILEDDLVVAEDFYGYTVQALEKYGEDERIAGISLYSHAWNEHGDYHFMPQQNGFDAYLGQFSCTWGQCWTAGQFARFRSWYEAHEGKLGENPDIPQGIELWGERSWGKYFVYYMVEKQLYYVMPYTALSTNCSELGEHNGVKNASYQVMLSEAVNKTYAFPLYEEAVKYDIFFERVFENITIGGIDCGDICIDLNGLKRTNGNKNYVATTIRDDRFELVDSFEMQFRPVEKNLTMNCRGNDIFLYKVSDCHETVRLNSRGDRSLQRAIYEIYNSGWLSTMRYAANDFSIALKHFITRK